jgi:hypothetical protein
MHNGLAAQATHQHDPQNHHVVKLKNPVDVQYLKKHMRRDHPRLILTPAIGRALKKDVQTDAVVNNVYAAIKQNAAHIMEQPLLTRNQIGRRLLGTSRDMLYRMNCLAMVYYIDKDPAILQRINDELMAVCNFSDWNPSHFLDVAEMATAVAIGLDWTAGDLPTATQQLARNALIEKGIRPSFPESGQPGWVDNTNNWNQVCNGGMIAAALMIAETDWALAAKTISRALDGMPHALAEYGPDGVYPEGSTYWSYGTSYTVLTASMLQSALGTDFGLSGYPAFMESADFKLLSVAPSGCYYNFADCGDCRSDNGDMTLAWFAAASGNPVYYEKDRFMIEPEKQGELSRFAGAGLVWLSQFEAKSSEPLPHAWKGEGANPVVIFRGGQDDPRQFYLGAKGGRGTVNHGNMDAGSFIFELDGVRWSVDPGNQSYNELESAGFNLWGRCQDCPRWTLLTKNNFGHSTITINDALHRVDGFAGISDFKEGETPEATIALSAAFGGLLQQAERRFVKENDHTLLIEDQLVLSDSTEMVTWQLMTTADVEPTSYGAMLRQDGRQLRMEADTPGDIKISVISLDPPPLALDRQIDNLKRIELRIPAHVFDNRKGTLRVRLSGV